MTIDRSLRVRKGMLSNRNVLKRAERLEKLKETERWQEGDSIFGLPKVKIQKVALKRKKKVKKIDEGDEAATEAAPEETDT
ncbi:MAG: small basic protein [Planctomycetaceae bacterium]|nr:small basic protein [Planctomycetaceae bacterium]MCP4812130.1 small basic protein [Planctomycetaceae bacterium]